MAIEMKSAHECQASATTDVLGYLLTDSKIGYHNFALLYTIFQQRSFCFYLASPIITW